jgi:hypothetical protein
LVQIGGDPPVILRCFDFQRCNDRVTQNSDFPSGCGGGELLMPL